MSHSSCSNSGRAHCNHEQWNNCECAHKLIKAEIDSHSSLCAVLVVANVVKKPRCCFPRQIPKGCKNLAIH